MRKVRSEASVARRVYNKLTSCTVRLDPLVGVVRGVRLLIALSAYSLTGSRILRDTVIRGSCSIVSQLAGGNWFPYRAV